MDSASATAYAVARPGPVAIHAVSAITHLNGDHPDALRVIADAVGGYPDVTMARCSGLDRRGIDLALDTPRGRAPTRVAFSSALDNSAQRRERPTMVLVQPREAAKPLPAIHKSATRRKHHCHEGMPGTSLSPNHESTSCQ
jgi:hypothetical protein